MQQPAFSIPVWQVPFHVFGSSYLVYRLSLHAVKFEEIM
jgi:hypothetical protein